MSLRLRSLINTIAMQYWFIAIVALTVALIFLLHYNFWRWPVSQVYPRVLMYHSISPSEKKSGMNVWPCQFERHIQYLMERGWSFVFVSELPRYWGHNKIVAITLDDGFENNFEFAFPILQKYNVKATIYLSPKAEGIDLLKEAQIKTMLESNLVEFGAHTMSHCNLLSLKQEEAYMEMAQSKQYVEAITSKPCTSFSYPYGRYRNVDIDSVAKLGFNTAVTTKKNLSLFSPNNLLQIPRIGVGGNVDIVQFYLIISRGRYRV